MTAILNGCWYWKEYEFYLGPEEMLGRGVTVRGIPGQGSWVVRIFILEGGAVKRMGLWGVRWYWARKEVWALGGWRRVCLGKVPGRSGFEGSMGALGWGEKSGTGQGRSFGRCVLNNGLKGVEVLWGRIMGRG